MVGRDDARMNVLGSQLHIGPSSYVQVTLPKTHLQKILSALRESAKSIISYRSEDPLCSIVVKGEEESVRYLAESELGKQGIKFDDIRVYF